MVTDPISDLLTRMRNAIKAHKIKANIPHSKLKCTILEVFKKNNYIKDFKVVKSGKFDEIEIEFNLETKISHLRRVSKPGQRIYVKRKDIRLVLNGYGISVLSTPKGVMTGGEARKQGLGGEYICEIW